MKRLKILMVGCLFALLVAASLVKVNPKYDDNRAFMLTNAEALAQGEGGPHDCAGSGSVICGGGTYKVRFN